MPAHQQRLHKPFFVWKWDSWQVFIHQNLLQPHPFSLLWAHPLPPPQNNNTQTLLPKYIAPPPSTLSSACLLIGRGANGVPVGYAREGCTSLCGALCACVRTYWLVNRVWRLHTRVTEANVSCWWTIASEESHAEQSLLACFYAKARDRQPECSAHWAATLPGHPPPSPLLSTSSTVVILADTTHKGLILAASFSSRDLLYFSSSSDPLQPGCLPVQHYAVSVRLLATVYHISGKPASSSPCIPSSSSASSFRERIRTGLQPLGSLFFCRWKLVGPPAYIFFYHLMHFMSRR